MRLKNQQEVLIEKHRAFSYDSRLVPSPTHLYQRFQSQGRLSSASTLQMTMQR
jgi:hypothetical protein